MFLEIAIVIILTLFNGLLAMSELAIVSARTARLKVMADQGSKGAGTAIRLAADPGRFLSSVQIGITLVGILSGAFSGATLGVRLTDALTASGVSPAVAQPLAVGGVVVVSPICRLSWANWCPSRSPCALLRRWRRGWRH